jgi:hypothetical protein
LQREPGVAPPVYTKADSAETTMNRPIQRSPAETRSGSDAAAQNPMITTEIGQLPADLWRELGVVPPATTPLDSAEIISNRPIQRNPAETNSNTDASAQNPMIATEVGQLPADLWRELDVALPSKPLSNGAAQFDSGMQRESLVQRARRSNRDSVQREPEIENVAESAESEAESALELPAGSMLLYVDEDSASRAKQGTVPVWLQRQDGGGGAIIRAFADSGMFEDFEMNADEPEVSDTLTDDQVEALSRQVYAQLKRRLDVDWERARSRI